MTAPQFTKINTHGTCPGKPLKGLMTTRIPHLFALLLLVTLAVFDRTVCAQPATTQPATTRPNVVVMIADDLGSGDVSCLFRDVVKTPNIDRLAAMGVKFTSGYVTAPLCGPSRAGFFTGRYQQRFGFVDNSGGIPTDLPLLPGVLRDAGYRTALIGKWHSAGPMPSERGCFDESLCSVKSSPFINYHHPVLSRNGKTEKFDEYSTDLFAREAEAFIDRNKDRPVRPDGDVQRPPHSQRRRRPRRRRKKVQRRHRRRDHL